MANVGEVEFQFFQCGLFFGVVLPVGVLLLVDIDLSVGLLGLYIMGGNTAISSSQCQIKKYGNMIGRKHNRQLTNKLEHAVLGLHLLLGHVDVLVSDLEL